MTLRLTPAHLAPALLLALASAIHAEPRGEEATPLAPAGGASAAATDTTVLPDDITSMGTSTAPPAPQLGPDQAYRPLNFYTREELATFPADRVPAIAPACHGAYVAPPLPPLPGSESDETAPVYAAADSMLLNEDGESQIEGSVEVRRGQHMMRADRAIIGADRNRLVLDGNVYLQDPAMTLEASRADLTLDGTDSHIRDARYVMHDARVRGSADAIDRSNPWRVEITGGGYTTCEPGRAAWMLVAGRIRLDQEQGWGSASHVQLRVQNVPVLYVPYVTFPIDKRRRTGLLYPTLGFSSEGGTDISLPYYFNLDPQYDLVLTPRWIENRGSGAAANFRYLHGSPDWSLGNGEFDVSWIGEDSLYNNEQRYLFRYRHSGAPQPGWQVFADATDVSDNDFIDDIDNQLTTNRDSQLLRIAQLRRSTDTWTALARLQSYQGIDPTIPLSDQPYRRLPQMYAQWLQPTTSGLQWGGQAEFSVFDRDVELAYPHGSRVRLDPQLRWPLQAESSRVVPALKLRYAAYDLQDNPGGDTLSRVIPTASLDATLFLERNFVLHDSVWTQTLEPRIYALWTPYRDQDDTPLLDTDALTFSYEQLFRDNRFAGGDRVGDAEQISLALESRFLATDGSEHGRLAVGQAIYLDDRRVQRVPAAPAETDRLSPFVANALWQLGEQWHARAEGQWSSDDGEFVRGSLQAGWQDKHFRTLNVGYRYDSPGIDQAELSSLLPVDEAWSLVGRWVFDFETARSLETIGGIEFESCCWRARLLARHTVDSNSTALVTEDSIVFEIELKGLGSLGEKISSELAKVIPGYEERRKALP